MDRGTLLPVVLVTVAALVGTAMAQTAPPPAAQGETGFTSYAEFGGTSNSDGQIYELNSSVGYNFSQHFGVDMGVPRAKLLPISLKSPVRALALNYVTHPLPRADDDEQGGGVRSCARDPKRQWRSAERFGASIPVSGSVSALGLQRTYLLPAPTRSLPATRFLKTGC